MIIGILEDDSRVAKLTKTMLEYAGHECIIFEDGKTLLKILLEEKPVRIPLPIDILLLDLHLPYILGSEVAQRIRNIIPPKILPIIVITQASTVERIQVSILIPDAQILMKPVNFVELLNALNNIHSNH